MSIRGFGYQTVLGTPQPVFGTTLTAASANPTPDPYTGTTDPRSQPSSLVLAVTNPYIFRKGDKVIVGAGTTFEQTNTTQMDLGTVTVVNTGASTITVSGLTRAHASGEFVVLSIQASIITIIANANLLYLGEDFTVGVASKTLVALIGASGSYGIGISGMGNVYGTAHFWLLGTAADTFLPSLTTI